jgi:hypothetical protein
MHEGGGGRGFQNQWSNEESNGTAALNYFILAVEPRYSPNQSPSTGDVLQSKTMFGQRRLQIQLLIIIVLHLQTAYAARPNLN